MLKVTLIAMSLSERDGAGRYSVNLIQELASRCALTVFAPRHTGISESLLNLAGCEIHPILPPLSFKRNVLASPIYALKIAPLSREADIVHSLFGFPYSFLAALTTLVLGKPLVVTALGTYSVSPLTRPVYGILLKWSFKRARRVLCISRFTQRKILERVPLENTMVVPMGVDYERFQINLEEAKKERIVLSVGAVKARKGFDVLIKALARLKKEGLEAHCYIAGDTSSRHTVEALLKLAEAEGVNKEVHFLGSIPEEDLVKWYHRSDVFALTPRNIKHHFEGFGIVYLEANACGKPVVGALGCGAEEPITHGYNGLLVPQNDVTATAEAIKYLLSHPAAAREMGCNGRQRAREMSWATTAEMTIKEYEVVLADDRPTQRL